MSIFLTIVKENTFLTVLIFRVIGYSGLVPASSNLLRSENAHNELGSQERRQIYSIGRKPLWLSHENTVSTSEGNGAPLLATGNISTKFLSSLPGLPLSCRSCFPSLPLALLSVSNQFFL